MIHSFSVSNFHSVHKEAVLDLRIPKTAPDLPRFRQSPNRPDIRLPSVVVLMGPNGSGKTTLLRALINFVRLISTPWAGNQKPLSTLMLPFFSKTARDEPTRFCVEFEADWLNPYKKMDLLRYEMSARGGEQITYEALFHFPNGRRRRLFERDIQEKAIYVSSEFEMKPKDDRLKAVRDDVSVIATFASLNVPLAKLIVERLENFLLSTNIMGYENWTPPTKVVIEILERNPHIMEMTKQKILRSDLAIRDMKLVTGDNNKHVIFDHYGLDAPVPLFMESSGTKRLFHLLPQICIALDDGNYAVIDEIDSDLHVDLVSEVCRWFQSPKTNPNHAQLFITSHNVGLLDDLEKEELFIVEKGEDSETRVHGAQDMRGLRRGSNLYAKYRLGVLGGLPKIG